MSISISYQVDQSRIAASTSTNAVSFSSARTMKRCPAQRRPLTSAEKTSDVAASTFPRKLVCLFAPNRRRLLNGPSLRKEPQRCTPPRKESAKGVRPRINPSVAPSAEPGLGRVSLARVGLFTPSLDRRKRQLKSLNRPSSGIFGAGASDQPSRAHCFFPPGKNASRRLHTRRQLCFPDISAARLPV